MVTHLALGVDKGELARVGLGRIEPAERRALVGRRVLDDELELVAFVVRLAELDGEGRAEVRVTLGREREGEVVRGRGREVGALDGEVGRVEHDLVLRAGVLGSALPAHQGGQRQRESRRDARCRRLRPGGGA